MTVVVTVNSLNKGHELFTGNATVNVNPWVETIIRYCVKLYLKLPKEWFFLLKNSRLVDELLVTVAYEKRFRWK